MLLHPLLACSLDYPGIGPEHSFLKDWGRAEYFAVTDDDALAGFQRLSKWVRRVLHYNKCLLCIASCTSSRMHVFVTWGLLAYAEQ